MPGTVYAVPEWMIFCACSMMAWPYFGLQYPSSEHDWPDSKSM